MGGGINTFAVSLKKLKIGFALESSFRDGNNAGANQQIKFFHIDETSERLWRNGIMTINIRLLHIWNLHVATLPL